MKKLKGKVIITGYKEGIATALYQDGKPVELSYDTQEKKIAVGNIYVGKVAKIVKNIQAAFVEVEDGICCYYPVDKNGSLIFTSKGKAKNLAAGDELLVQISREAAKTKAPSVTSAISFAGKYLVLAYGKTKIGFSHNLTAADKERLSLVMDEFKHSEYGWIVRTNAANASDKELSMEAKRLSQTYQELTDEAKYRPCRTCLYRTPPEYLMQIKNYHSEDYEEIVTDKADIFHEIKAYLEKYQPEDAAKLRLHEDRLLPLAKLYSLETAFENALCERVWLKSGAYLIIQPTEALTVIDVNTGKYDGRKELQDTFLKINLEAAKETARQLRLRNLSGIIIVDFINMASEENRKLVMKTLAEELKRDSKKAAVVDMTPLGLVEITRKRENKPLMEKLKK